YELLPEDPADLEFSNKGYLIGGGGIDGPGVKLRRDFPGTAVWLPALRTDREGRLTVRFKAPDALTRYRLVAVAHAGTDRFGSGESAFNIRKKLMILSALGQIANVGDQIVARAVLRNESGADGNATIALELDSTAESAKGELNAKFALKNGETRTVDFPVKLRAVGDAGWKWSAHLEGGGKVFDDSVAASLKVGHPAPLLHETYLTDIAGASSDLLAGVNPQVLEGDGTVRVTLSNTRLASLRETATALLEYPYGCAEQTVSSLIPWITFNDLGPVMPDLAKTNDERQKVIRTGVAKIFALQTDGGGLAYWPGGHQAGLFQSAYAALALGLLEKQGEELPPGWPKLLTYLSEELRGIGERNARFSPGDAALAVYALASADKAEPAYHEQLYARRAELSHESRALLASAIMEAGGPAKLVGTLLDPRAAAPENFSWFGGASRERATRLLAWTRFKPGDKEVARLVKELLAARVNGKWRTTQENAWAMLALSRYFTAIEREVKPVDGSLVKTGIEAPFALTKKDLTKTVKFAFDAARPLGALEVMNPQKGALFGETNFVVRPPVVAQPRQDRGYAVSRSYQKIAGDGALQPATDLQVGDRVLVTLRLETPQPGHFVAIDDPLPAILEAINPDFRAQGGEEFSRADYREIRADRVLYFCDHLPAGAFTFRYLARVRTAGTVTAPSTKVEEMYRPERFGLSATAQLVSRAAE
ncbi:MAG: alpha-2-macroglobulin family protein, partial [Chthoniobacteraceae bacterium]